MSALGDVAERLVQVAAFVRDVAGAAALVERATDMACRRVAAELELGVRQPNMEELAGDAAPASQLAWAEEHAHVHVLRSRLAQLAQDEANLLAEMEREVHRARVRQSTTSTAGA